MQSRLTKYGLNDDLAGIQSLLSNKDISIHSELLFFVSQQVKIHEYSTYQFLECS
jgi:hypothetical protein